ncbi:MAG: hypothetical protein ABIJ09_16080 [Pseudomonadota bacterium]
MLVRPLCDSHVEALDFLKNLGQAGADFMQEEGVLAYFLYNMRLFKPELTCVPFKQLKEMITSWCPRPKLAGLAGLPATNGTINILRRFRLEALSRGTALRLASMIRDEESRQRLSRLGQIDCLVLGVVSSAGDYVSDAFLKDLVAHHRSPKTADGRSLLALLHEVRSLATRNLVGLPVFDTVDQVEKKLRQLEVKELLKSPAMQRPYPPSPIPTVPGVVHLSNGAELTEHSRAHGICLDTSDLYRNPIEQGRLFAYRFEPPFSKRAGTVLVDASTGRPRFDSAKYSHNRDLTDSTQDREVVARLLAWVALGAVRRAPVRAALEAGRAEESSPGSREMLLGGGGKFGRG